MVELIVFVLGVLALIVIAVWISFTVVVLVAAIPAIGVAVGLVHLGLPLWAAILLSFLVFACVVGAWDERREKRKTEPRRPGPGGVAGAQAADAARRTRARLSSR